MKIKTKNENHSAALIHKEWHFGLKKHEGKRKFRLLSMSHWPDSLQLGEPTRCSLLNLLPFSCCCCLLCVVNKYCCAIWIRYSQTFHMLYFSNTWCWAFVVGVVNWKKFALGGRFSTDFRPKVTDQPRIFCLASIWSCTAASKSEIKKSSWICYWNF